MSFDPPNFFRLLLVSRAHLKQLLPRHIFVFDLNCPTIRCVLDKNDGPSSLIILVIACWDNYCLALFHFFDDLFWCLLLLLLCQVFLFRCLSVPHILQFFLLIIITIISHHAL